MTIGYTVPEILHMMSFIVFDNFVLFYLASSPKNEDFKTMKKKQLEISFYTYVPNIMSR